MRMLDCWCLIIIQVCSVFIQKFDFISQRYAANNIAIANIFIFSYTANIFDFETSIV